MMKLHSKGSWRRMPHSDKRQATSNTLNRLPSVACRMLLVASCLSLVAALTGCESLQRKLTRKRKGPVPRPTPIIQFQDYTRTMTPLDRYRKHALMLDYWNGDLLASLDQRPLNPKRVKKASTESLQELQTMRSLVTDDVAVRFDPMLSERTALDREFQTSDLTLSTAPMVQRRVEAQTRQINREFSWRDMEEHLKARE